MTVPLTAFEQRDHVAPWTSRQEEDQWIDDLLASTNRWTMSVVGQSPNGNPMRLFSIGTGPRKILHCAQQHGSELSGREAWFTTMRQWADSTDPDLLDYLTQVTVLVMPTCHPDDLDVRENANGVNLNRDHVQLTQGETRAIHSVIRDRQPDVVVDWHEGRNISMNYATSPAFNANADAGVLALSQELSDVVKGAIEASGATWELYQAGYTMKGPENLCNNVALHNRVGVLLETERQYGDDSTAARRHAHHLIAVDAIWRWHHQHHARVRDEVTAADQRVQQRVGTTFLLHVGTSSSGPVVTPPRAGYFLDDTQWDAISVHRDLFGIDGAPLMDGFVIPIEQAMQSIVVYLVDPESPEHVVSAAVPPPVREMLHLDDGTVAGYEVQLDGVIYDVVGARINLDGVEYEVLLPGM